MSTRIVRYKIPSVLSAAWAKGFGDITPNNSSSDSGVCVATDALGNIYWAGYFNGTIDLGGSASERLTATAGSFNLFLAKFDRTGSHIWSRHFTSSGTSATLQVAVSAITGSIYFAGLFTGGSVVKLNAAGEVQWIKGPSSGAYRVALGLDDSIAITGFFIAPFQSQMDFGNGITLYSSFSSRDVFLAKYDASGTCLWAKSFGNNGGTDEGFGVAVNQSDNNSIFVGGWAFGQDIYLNGPGGTMGLPADTPHYYRTTAQQNTFSFLAKFDSAGTIVWSRAMGTGVASDPYNTFTRLQSLAIDSDGNLLTGGAYNIKSNWGAGSYTGTTAADRNGWVAKYNGASGALMWVQPIDGNRTLWVTGVAVGPQNSLVCAGYFFGTYDFGGATLSNPHNVPNHNIYIAKYSSAGVLNVPSLRQFGSTPIADAANGVAVDGDYALLTGYFQATVDFNGTNLTSKGGLDAFLMRLLH